GMDTLTKEDLNDDNNNMESNEKESEEIEEVDILLRLITEMNQIEHW
ncbi:2361_t:CDS:1, partial [Scutellospora calospora]